MRRRPRPDDYRAPAHEDRTSHPGSHAGWTPKVGSLGFELSKYNGRPAVRVLRLFAISVHDNDPQFWQRVWELRPDELNVAEIDLARQTFHGWLLQRDLEEIARLKSKVRRR